MSICFENTAPISAAILVSLCIENKAEPAVRNGISELCPTRTGAKDLASGSNSVQLNRSVAELYPPVVLNFRCYP